MKTILHMLTAFASLLCASASAQTSLTIGSPSALAGSAVSVPVTAVGIADMQGFQFTIDYDMSKLTYVNCTDWSGGTNASGVQINPLSGQGKLTFVYNDLSVNLTSGLFFNLNFTVDAGATGSATVAWSDVPTPRELSNSVPVVITASFINGAVNIQTESAIANNVLSAGQSICAGDVPNTITGSTPTGGNGTFQYLWQSSTTGPLSGFSAAAGTNDQQDYSPQALSVTTWFIREVSSGSFTDASTAVEVTVTPLPDATPSALSAAFCEGESTDLSGPGDANVSYTWLDGDQNGIASGNDFNATAGGTYYLQAQQSGCAATSAAITVTEHPLPTAPTITQNGADLSSSYATGNQWYLEGAIIDGATAQTYTPTANGNYTVVHTDANTCAATSQPYNMLTVGISAATAEGISVSPNPSSGVFVVSGTGAMQCTVHDALGREVLRTATRTIDLSTAPAGVYTLTVNTAAGTTSHRLIRE